MQVIARWALCIGLVAGLAAGPAGAAQDAAPFSSRYSSDEPLSAEQAFPMSVMTGRNGEVLVRWEMPAGYLLYADKVSFAARGGLVIKHVRMPTPMIKNDPMLGAVKILRDEVTVVVEPMTPGMRGELLVQFQGCAENRICYPQIRRVFQING